MGRYIGPKNKIARRFGVNLGLKTNPTKVARRLSQPPGVHGPNKRKGTATSFGKQMLEKQKAKYIYGLRERQLTNYVNEATGQAGDSGVTLSRMLEHRLDNVVFRLGFAATRAQARQMVTHGMFVLNGKPMNIPSHRAAAGDVIGLKETKAKKKIFEGLSERLTAAQMPSWLTIDAAKASGKVIGSPAETEFDKVFDVKMIIEYYSSR